MIRREVHDPWGHFDQDLPLPQQVFSPRLRMEGPAFPVKNRRPALCCASLPSVDTQSLEDRVYWVGVERGLKFRKQLGRDSGNVRRTGHWQ